MSSKNNSDLSGRVIELNRKLARTNRVVFGLSVAFLAVVLTASRPSKGAPSVLRARGLFIEDASGRARILIGAPTPIVPERQRKDATTGMVIINEAGWDRVAVGSPTPDPQMRGRVSKRIGGSSGITVMDTLGNERGGFSAFDFGRVVFAIDYPNGREAGGFWTDDREGYVALLLDGERARERAGFFVGRDGTALMKLADTTGLERLIIRVKDDSSVRFFEVDTARKALVDWRPKLP